MRLLSLIAAFVLSPAAFAEPTVYTKVLDATEVKTFAFHEAWDSSAWYCSPRSDGLAPTYPSDAQMIWAGQSFAYAPGTDPLPCASKRDYIYRGAIRFDLRTIPSRSIKAAYLEFDRTWQFDRNTQLSCAARVTQGNANWAAIPRDTSYFDTGLPINPLPPQGAYQNGITTVDGATHHFTVDVSSAVKGWIQSGANTGFMVTSNDERTFPNTTTMCLSGYGNFKLLVGYYE